MRSTAHLFKVRAKMKAHQPLFVVKEYHKSARVKKRWRAQRGIHSGHRQMHRGKPAQPTPGFGVPRAVRGLHSSGLQPVLVHSLAQLDAIDPQVQGIIIGAAVGTRKRLQLLETAMKKKIILLGAAADVHKAIDAIKSAFSVRVKAKKDKLSTKNKKEEEKKKKADDQKKKEETKVVATGEKASGSSIEDAVARDEKEKDKKNKEQREAVEKILIQPP